MILRAVQSVELLTGGLPTAFNRSIVPAEISVLYAEDSKPAKKASFSFEGHAFLASFIQERFIQERRRKTVRHSRPCRERTLRGQEPTMRPAHRPRPGGIRSVLLACMQEQMKPSHCIRPNTARNMLVVSLTLLGTGRGGQTAHAGEGVGPESVESE